MPWRSTWRTRSPPADPGCVLRPPVSVDHQRSPCRTRTTPKAKITAPSNLARSGQLEQHRVLQVDQVALTRQDRGNPRESSPPIRRSREDPSVFKLLDVERK